MSDSGVVLNNESMDGKPAGWYSDPTGEASHQAYWNGKRWTGTIRSGEDGPVTRKRNSTARALAIVGLIIGLLVVTPFATWWFWPQNVEILRVWEVEGRPSSIQLGLRACGPGVYQDYNIVVEETAERVNVHVSNGPRWLPIQPACMDSMVVELDGPIGDRLVFDRVADSYVQVQPGP